MAGKDVTETGLSVRCGDAATAFIEKWKDCLDLNDFFLRNTDSQLIAAGVPSTDIPMYRAAFCACEVLWRVANAAYTPAAPDNYLLNLYKLTGVPGT